MGKLHMPTIIIDDRPSDITVARHFRPKSGHYNERVYCTPIDRALKIRLKERSPRFLRPIIPELWKSLKNQKMQKFSLSKKYQKYNFECNGYRAVVKYT